MTSRVELANQLTVGWSVYERQDDLADYEPRGGTVVGREDRTDDETGEVVRWFHLVKHSRGQIVWSTLPEDKLNLELAQLPNALTIRSLVRAMAAKLAKGKGQLLSDDVRLIEMMRVLAKAVG